MSGGAWPGQETHVPLATCNTSSLRLPVILQMTATCGVHIYVRSNVACILALWLANSPTKCTQEPTAFNTPDHRMGQLH